MIPVSSSVLRSSSAAVGGDVPAIESRDDLARAEEREIQITRVGRGKIDQPLLRMLSLTVRVSAPLSGCLAVTLCSTLCHHRVAFRIELNVYTLYTYNKKVNPVPYNG